MCFQGLEKPDEKFPRVGKLREALWIAAMDSPLLAGRMPAIRTAVFQTALRKR